MRYQPTASLSFADEGATGILPAAAFESIGRDSSATELRLSNVPIGWRHCAGPFRESGFYMQPKFGGATPKRADTNLH